MSVTTLQRHELALLRIPFQSDVQHPMTPRSPSLPPRAEKKNGNTKRKRPETTADDHSASGSGRETQKKKKANRACFHCQKAHLTCGDERPCQRCVKRGLADNCTEGLRKKAKYLLDDDELEALKQKKKQETATVHDCDAPDHTPHQADPIRNASFDSSYSFGSEATNIEYSILSAMLGNPSHDDPHLHQPGSLTPRQQPSYLPNDDPTLLANPAWPAPPPNPAMSGFQPGSRNSPRSDPMFNPYQPPSTDMNLFGSEGSPQLHQHLPPFAAPRPSYQHSAHNRATSFLRTASARSSQMGLAPPSPPPSNPSPGSPMESISGQSSSVRSSRVYQSVDKAYDYTQGYHFLMQHLRDRFDKNDTLRIVRALAIFRPSLIALQMPLSEEDEVFVEKSFQRSLLELEKLISFSGTPTVVWRRTGEICVVGLEFTMLTDWTRQDLLGNRKYIYELFENQSVVEYWEAFAKHAFENSSQSVYSHCVLLKPSGVPVPCSFCFSIRRDIFDLPSIVIGQWLPLLL